MTKNQLILVMGVFLVIFPNLGFSIFLEGWSLRIIGAILVIMFFVTYFDRKKNNNDKGDETFIREEITEIYVESSPRIDDLENLKEVETEDMESEDKNKNKS